MVLKEELNAERAEAGQERLAIEGLLVDVQESVKRRAALEEARKILESIAEMVRQRGPRAEEQATGNDLLGGALLDLGASLKTRRTVLENELRSLDAEIPRWHEYYAARLARAQAECALINPQGTGQKRPARRDNQ